MQSTSNYNRSYSYWWNCSKLSYFLHLLILLFDHGYYRYFKTLTEGGQNAFLCWRLIYRTFSTVFYYHDTQEGLATPYRYSVSWHLDSIERLVINKNTNIWPLESSFVVIGCQFSILMFWFFLPSMLWIFIGVAIKNSLEVYKMFFLFPTTSLTFPPPPPPPQWSEICIGIFKPQLGHLIWSRNSHPISLLSNISKMF